MRLRDYQQEIFDDVQGAASNDLVRLDTGAGKTPIEAALSRDAEYSMVVAHRITLIRQISEKLAAFGLDHDTISTEQTRRRCAAAHGAHNRCYIQRGHRSRLAASIDSIVAQHKRGALTSIASAPWLVIIDEAHHVIPENKWGWLRELLPNARFVGFTATPLRMDGESLHSDKGGLFDRLVQAKSLGNDSAHELIQRGYLSDFVAYRPMDTRVNPVSLARKDELYAEDLETLTPEEFDYYQALDDRGITVLNPFQHRLDYRLGELYLHGDPIKEYRRCADGTQAIIVCPAISNAVKFAREFRDAGISAAAIHSDMPQSRINRALDAFKRGQIRVICNVDMIGEGFDMPAVTTLIIASITGSFGRYRQWVGRVLRPAPGKSGAIILDLTGMVGRHGMPDDAVEWDLLSPPRGPKQPVCVPCAECGALFRVRLEYCPECGADNRLLGENEPGTFLFEIKYVGRSLIEQARRQVSDDKYQQRRHEEIIWPHFGECSTIGKAVDRVRAAYVETLDAAGVPRLEINDFLSSQDAKDHQFWVARFTARDAGQMSKSKALQVHRRWRTNA